MNNHDLMDTSSKTAPIEVKPWYPLRLLSLYRIFIAVLLLSIQLGGIAKSSLGVLDPQLFFYTGILYLLFAGLTFLMQYLRIPTYETQAYAQISGDIIFITLLMYASGGVSSGLGILMVVSIAGGGILFSSIIGFFFAALASLAVLTVQLYSEFVKGIAIDSYAQTGTLGITLFASAALVALLNRRMRESEALASQTQLDLANLEQLNEHIIQQMQSGVIVIDPELNVRLINQSARELLGEPSKVLPVTLEALSLPLFNRYNLWRMEGTHKPARIRKPGSPFEVQPYFTPLGQHGNAGTLVVLEDTSAYTRELQDAKLASLGRLTASIAHEIRNPLSAIQHAAQLLEESPQIHTHDRRLTDIIKNQSSRMNTIIENIMQLSNRERVIAETIPLHAWLQTFKQDFCSAQPLALADLKITVTPDTLSIRIDPSQLHQILSNLCNNSLKYGYDNTGIVQIEISAKQNTQTGMIELDIRDHGTGVPEDIQQHIFEPFYTISTESTGLGLYIVRELCELNGAEIRYIPSQQGSCFRIHFNPANV